MGNVVPMDSKLLSNYWYMSWPSWPTHISKLCSHKDDNFVMRFIRHCTESDSHKSRCGWTLKKNYRSPSGFETIRITNVQTFFGSSREISVHSEEDSVVSQQSDELLHTMDHTETPCLDSTASTTLLVTSR